MKQEHRNTNDHRGHTIRSMPTPVRSKDAAKAVAVYILASLFIHSEAVESEMNVNNTLMNQVGILALASPVTYSKTESNRIENNVTHMSCDNDALSSELMHMCT